MCISYQGQRQHEIRRLHDNARRPPKLLDRYRPAQPWQRMETNESNADSKPQLLIPNRPLAMQLTDQGIRITTSEKTSTLHEEWKCEPLRYATSAGEYGRYLPLIKTQACDYAAAGNDTTKTETLSTIVPGWRRFTRLQTQIGMYRSSSFNWLVLFMWRHSANVISFSFFHFCSQLRRLVGFRSANIFHLNPTLAYCLFLCCH